jgi:hypothetical protein
MMGRAPAPAPAAARRPAAGSQRDRAAAKLAGPRAAGGGSGGGKKGSAVDIELAVRIRPGPETVVNIGAGGAVNIAGDSFSYQSSVVSGSDQVVAFDALASRLVSRAQQGYSCTLMVKHTAFSHRKTGASVETPGFWLEKLWFHVIVALSLSTCSMNPELV